MTRITITMTRNGYEVARLDNQGGLQLLAIEQTLEKAKTKKFLFEVC